MCWIPHRSRLPAYIIDILTVCCGPAGVWQSALTRYPVRMLPVCCCNGGICSAQCHLVMQADGQIVLRSEKLNWCMI